MDNFEIAGNKFVPEILFNATSGILSFKGKAILEDSKEIFGPAKDWVSDFITAFTGKIVIDIDLIYFNSVVSKELFSIMTLVKKYNGDKEVRWHYDEEDEEALEEGKSFQEETKLPFEFIPE